MTTLTATEEQIRTAGFAALHRELGPVGTIRFMQQFNLGCGDYTANRDQFIGDLTAYDIMREIEALRDAKNP